MSLKLHPTMVVGVLILGVIVLMLLHILACIPMSLGVRDYPLGFFNLDGEVNLPTVYSTALLWSNALLVACIAWAGKEEGRVNRGYWLGLVLAFLFMGFDESVMLHERTMGVVRETLNTSGVLFFAWVIPYTAFTIAFVLFYRRFFFRLPKDTRKHIAIAAVLYLAGAIGIELWSGSWISVHGRDGVYYYIFVTIEESLEMLGSIAFIYAFARHIDLHIPKLFLRITSE